MARKLTIKQEKFCQLYIENGGNASEAYRGSYNAAKMTKKTITETASRLLKKGNISARVRCLQAKHAEKHNITVEWLTEKYLETFEMACQQGKASEAKGVLDSLGKLHGHMVEKKQVNGNIQHNHTTEPVSTTLEWVGTVLRGTETIEVEKSLSH